MKIEIKVNSEWFTDIFVVTQDASLQAEYFAELSRLLLGNRLSDGLSPVVLAAILPISRVIAQRLENRKALGAKRAQAAHKRWDRDEPSEQPDTDRCKPMQLHRVHTTKEKESKEKEKFPPAPPIKEKEKKEKENPPSPISAGARDGEGDGLDELKRRIQQLRSSPIWLESMAQKTGLTVSEVRGRFPDFIQECIANGKERHTSIADVKTHFNSWLRIRLNSEKKHDNGNNFYTDRNARRAAEDRARQAEFQQHILRKLSSSD